VSQIGSISKSTPGKHAVSWNLAAPKPSVSPSFPRVQVNQIGSITESIEAVKMSKAAGFGVMCSHRWALFWFCLPCPRMHHSTE
jgi:hypothetical protein